MHLPCQVMICLIWLRKEKLLHACWRCPTLEVLNDQVDCPVEPPVGAVQHNLTFIPIPKEE